MKAAALTRVSTVDQIDNTSLESQRRLIRQECQRRGWELVGVYEDAGVSGTKDDRPALSSAMQDARDGKFDVLVVYRLDRLGRSSVNVLRRIEELQSLGVGFVSLSEAFDTSTSSGKAMAGVFAIFSQLERETIVARTVAGQRAKVVSGTWPGGQPSYGWRLAGKGKDARPVPNAAERQTLARMVEWALAGRTTGEIARELNRQAVPTRSGADWSHTVVRRMLRNPALVTGEHHWGHVGKTGDRYFKTQADPRTGKPRHGEPVVLELPEPPLDRETFDALQQVLDSSPRSGRRQDNQQRQWLSTKVHGSCGRHYLGVLVLERNGIRRPVYRPECKRRPRPGQPECNCRQLDVAKLDAAVWAEVVAVLGDRERLLRLASEWTRQGASSESDARQVGKLTEQARKLGRAVERATDQAFMAEDPQVLLERVARYRAQLADVKSQLDRLQATGPEARGNARQLTELAALADRATERLKHLTDAERFELADLLDLRVEVSGRVVGGLPETVTVRGVLDPRLR